LSAGEKIAALSRVRKAKPSLASKAYAAIYRSIMTLDFEPGQPLEEQQLVDALEIGRTPVREALLRLAADFMVQSRPGRGFVVRTITLQNTRAAFEAMRIMETGVARCAVSREVSRNVAAMREANASVAEAIENNDLVALVDANSEFHRHFSLCSENSYLIEGLKRVRCEANRLAYLSFKNEVDPLRTRREHFDSVVRHHDELIALLEAQDEKSLVRVVDEHLTAFQRRIALYVST
jgi:DNA-binding GntR family transcriptional regulator